MSNPIIITTENITYSITTEQDETAFSDTRIPITIPSPIPGGIIAGGLFNIEVENILYSIEVEQTIQDAPPGIGYMAIGSTFIIA